MHSTELLDFLRGHGLDWRGRSFDAYLVANDTWWEDCHQHIQWAFPLPEPSKAQPTAPVADDAYYEAVQGNPGLRGRIMAMVGRYLQFLARTGHWRTPRDHNHLRITRVIRCLTLCGMDEVARTFRDYCVYELRDVGVPETTFHYWSEALTENPDFLS